MISVYKMNEIEMILKIQIFSILYYSKQDITNASVDSTPLHLPN